MPVPLSGADSAGKDSYFFESDLLDVGVVPFSESLSLFSFSFSNSASSLVVASLCKRRGNLQRGVEKLNRIVDLAAFLQNFANVVERIGTELPRIQQLLQNRPCRLKLTIAIQRHA